MWKLSPTIAPLGTCTLQVRPVRGDYRRRRARPGTRTGTPVRQPTKQALKPWEKKALKCKKTEPFNRPHLSLCAAASVLCPGPVRSRSKLGLPPGCQGWIPRDLYSTHLAPTSSLPLLPIHPPNHRIPAHWSPIMSTEQPLPFVYQFAAGTSLSSAIFRAPSARALVVNPTPLMLTFFLPLPRRNCRRLGG